MFASFEVRKLLTFEQEWQAEHDSEKEISNNISNITAVSFLAEEFKLISESYSYLNCPD
jgi:hypothetical protein